MAYNVIYRIMAVTIEQLIPQHHNVLQRQITWNLYKILWLYLRYDSVYLTCSKKLTSSQLSLAHGRPYRRSLYDLLNDAIFDDFQRPKTPISSACRCSTWNISETVCLHDRDILCLKKMHSFYFCNKFAECLPIFTARCVCIARTMPRQDVCPSVYLSVCHTPVFQARSQTSEWGGCVSERRRREDQGAAGAEGWVREGVSPSRWGRGLGRRLCHLPRKFLNF